MYADRAKSAVWDRLRSDSSARIWIVYFVQMHILYIIHLDKSADVWDKLSFFGVFSSEKYKIHILYILGLSLWTWGFRRDGYANTDREIIHVVSYETRRARSQLCTDIWVRIFLSRCVAATESYDSEKIFSGFFAYLKKRKKKKKEWEGFRSFY